MLRVLIHRKWKKEGYTVGRVFVDGEYLFNSLEDKDRGLHYLMPAESIKNIKVAGKTAIPVGTYPLTLSVSPKFKSRPWAKKYKGLVPEILDVPGFSNVRLHPGNGPEDTDGCPLVGKNTAVGKLTDSAKCYELLMSKYLYPAHLSKEPMQITIM